MNTIISFFNLLGRIWTKGNSYLRTAIFIVLAFPFFALIISLVNLSWLTALLAVLIFVGAACYLNTVILHPLLVTAIAETEGGKEFFGSIGVMLGFEVLFTIYCALVPVAENISLIPAFLLVVLALILFSSDEGKKHKKIKRVLILLTIGITASFFLPDLPRVAMVKIKKVNSAITEMEPKETLVPVGGLMETQEEKAEYGAIIAEDQARNIPPFISDPEDTLRFDFNRERLLFDPVKRERRKDIVTNGSYSPVVVIPWKVEWHLEVLDTTDVWFKDGSKLKIFPGMKPVDVERKVAVFRFKSNYPVTVWLDNI